MGLCTPVEKAFCLLQCWRLVPCCSDHHCGVVVQFALRVQVHSSLTQAVSPVFVLHMIVKLANGDLCTNEPGIIGGCWRRHPYKERVPCMDTGPFSSCEQAQGDLFRGTVN